MVEPAPEVVVLTLADSHIELQLRVWLPSGDVAVLKAQLLEQCWQQLNDQGFKTAYPQRHMHIHHHGKSEGLSDDTIAGGINKTE